MIIGPTKALFMDEITNGLDSSTAFQIVACLQQLVHITDATLLVSLLQPAPETFDLFDDLILMSEGKIVYHGPRDHVLEFFEDCGLSVLRGKGLLISFKRQSLCIKRTSSSKRRNSFIYVFKTVQLIIISFITMTVFLRTRMDVDVLHGNYYMGALFFALTILLVDGIPEMSMTLQRLEVFYKQRDLCFYPAWAYAVPATY
ncbi:hypothetical protein Pyn_00546 [Prunus yedoensis var. nudiflora]|uniref:ABC-2 type transporter transmembrane domain-containing protein n=1 Tax=Prunus yedoensis var. nudiflora TaxID=2094558 RepID=A0A314UKW4_PRUYE|nr:hypothetical protein Pyn_00546 [Prunus yedoensis var. nudiflora]